MVLDCKQVVEEAKFKAGRILVKAKYDLGNRILVDYKKFGRHEYGYKTQQDLGEELRFDFRRISEFVSFAAKISARALWFEP